eukprot:8501916-Heterocapsa_arctica.AAC.1
MTEVSSLCPASKQPLPTRSPTGDAATASPKGADLRLRGIQHSGGAYAGTPAVLGHAGPAR